MIWMITSVVLTRADIYEHPNWEKYHKMSGTGINELFERINWIGDYLDLGFEDFDVGVYKIRDSGKP